MTLSIDGTLVLIGIVAVISPILAELTGRLAIPDVVFELGLGAVIGPAILGLAHPAERTARKLQLLFLGCRRELLGNSAELADRLRQSVSCHEC